MQSLLLTGVISIAESDHPYQSIRAVRLAIIPLCREPPRTEGAIGFRWPQKVNRRYTEVLHLTSLREYWPSTKLFQPFIT